MTRDPDSSRHDLVMPLHAEKLVISSRIVTGDTVRVERITYARDEVLSEKLTNEKIEIERIPIGRIVDEAPSIRQENDTTIIPVVEEVFVVERKLVLKEEVRIRRIRVTENHHQSVSIREQTAVITRIKPEPVAASCIPYPTEPMSPITQKGLIMSEQTIVALYDTPAHAELAVQDLLGANIPAAAIDRHSQSGSYLGNSSSLSARPPEKAGFWARLFGGEPDHDTTVYDRSLESGGTAITVRVPEEQAVDVVDILEAHGPIDLEERASSYGLTSMTATPSPAYQPSVGNPTTAESGTMQLAEERLSVGKRVVNRGGTRIRRFVVETPVEEQVSLRDEKVTLYRRPIADGQPVANADFTNKTIEMTEMAEEAVVAKQAFVTEEIGLHKDTTERTETVRETLRRDDVEIERIPGETTISKPGFSKA